MISVFLVEDEFIVREGIKRPMVSRLLERPVMENWPFLL